MCMMWLAVVPSRLLPLRLLHVYDTYALNVTLLLHALLFIHDGRQSTCVELSGVGLEELA